MKRYGFLWVLLVPWEVSSLSSFTPEGRVIPQKNTQYEFQGRLFQTQSTFDKDGNESELDEGESFSLLNLDLLVRYGFGKRTEFFGGGRFRRIQTRYEEEDLEHSGMESLWGGIKLSLAKRRTWALAVEGRYEKTLYSNDQREQNAKEIILGDAGATTEILGHLTHLTSKQFSFSLSSGFRMRPEHLSSEIPFRGEGVFYKRQWAVTLGLNGVVSLDDDTDSKRPSYFHPVTSRFNSLNRSWTRGFIGANRVFGRWRIEGELGSVQSGVSTDKSFDMGISLIRSVGERRSQARRNKAKKIQSFKQYFGEGNVVKVSPKGFFVKIDKGMIHGVSKGMKIDIFKTNFTGSNVLYASGVIYQTKSESSILKIVKTFVKKKITVGMNARIYE